MKVSFTNDSELRDEPAFDLYADGIHAVEVYLNADPRNAVVIVGRRPIYILRGASEELNNFYYGWWPAEDPNDANGGELTATEAISEAIVDAADIGSTRGEDA